MPLGLEGTPIPLAGETSPSHILGLFEALDGTGALALYGGAGGSPPALGRVTPVVTHALDLRSGFDSVWSHSFTASNRNMCRKAERGGINVRRESSADAVDEYHRLYETTARSWGYDEAPYPRRLFSALLESDDAELWLAYAGDRAAAGALLLRGSEDLLYWSGAMDREFRYLAPSNAVMCAAIKSGCERQILYFDFGASAGLPGVEAFKKSFGAQPRQYHGVELFSWKYRRLEWLRKQVARSGLSR
jgi:lipid II:glycine glycyltransferase (peptidoglycan interpeptide bridge formation enzyme)